MNVMCEADGSVATMIDWGDAGWGEPAFDLADVPPGYLAHAVEGYEAGGGSLPGSGFEGRVLWTKLRRILGRADRGREFRPYLAELLTFAETAPGAWREFRPP